MTAVILRMYSIVCLFVLTWAIPSSIGQAGFPMNVGMSTMGNAQGGVSITPPDADMENTISSTADVSKRLETLNTTVEDLKIRIAGAGQCECSDTTATTTNANGIRSLRTAITTLEDTCSQQEADIEGMSTTVGQFKGSASSQDYSAKISELSKKLGVLTTDIEGVETKLQDASGKGISSEDLEEVRRDVSTLSQSVEEIDGQVSSCTTQCSTVAESSKSIDRKHQELQTSIEDLSERITTIQKGATAIKSRFKTIKASLASMDQTVNTAVKTASANTQDGKGSLESKLKLAESEMNSLKDSVETATGSLRSMKGDVEEATAELDKFQNALDKAKSQKEETLRSFQKSLDDMRSKLSGISGSASNYDGEIQKIDNRLETIENTASSVQTSINKLSKKIDALSNDLASTKRNMGKLDVSSDINTLNKDLENLGSRVKNIEKKLAPDCPSPFRKAGGMCYYVNFRYFKWAEANIMCQTVGGEKARLLVIKDNWQLRNYQNLLSYYGGSEFWVGLSTTSYTTTHTAWTWAGGYEWSSEMPWNYNEDKVSGYSCAALQDQDYWGTSHKLSSYSCDESFYSVCEIPQ